MLMLLVMIILLYLAWVNRSNETRMHFYEAAAIFWVGITAIYAAIQELTEAISQLN